jgi:hypothetical protein
MAVGEATADYLRHGESKAVGIVPVVLIRTAIIGGARETCPDSEANAHLRQGRQLTTYVRQTCTARG